MVTTATLQHAVEESFQAARKERKRPNADKTTRELVEAAAQAASLLQQDKTEEALDGLSTIVNAVPPQAIGADIHVFLVRAWALMGAFYALEDGLLPCKLEPAERGVSHFLAAIHYARAVGLGSLAEELVRFVLTKGERQAMTPEEEDALEALELAVRLGDIPDPLEGWKALAEEVGKVWPKGVSAVQAIREQRR